MSGMNSDATLSILIVVLAVVAAVILFDEFYPTVPRTLPGAYSPTLSSVNTSYVAPADTSYAAPAPSYIPSGNVYATSTTRGPQVPTFRTQGHQDLVQTSSAANPKQYGLPSIQWSVQDTEVDAPWRGSQDARNLTPGRNPQYHVPLLSYSFPAAGGGTHIAALGSADSAGFHETGPFARPGRDVTNTEQSIVTYRDVLSADI